MNSDQTFAIVMVLIASTLFAVVRLFKGPVGQVLARRWGGEGSTRDDEILELRARVAELEERVDFAERVLLKEPERGQISTGRERP